MIANPIITRSVGQLIIEKLENFTQNLVKDIAALLWLRKCTHPIVQNKCSEMTVNHAIPKLSMI
jgi:hypothetical protein